VEFAVFRKACWARRRLKAEKSVRGHRSNYLNYVVKLHNDIGRNSLRGAAGAKYMTRGAREEKSISSQGGRTGRQHIYTNRLALVSGKVLMRQIVKTDPASGLLCR